MTSMISLKNVSLKKGGILILEDIDLEIKKGDYMALFGPNGAGKTSLMNVILGLEDGMSGSVKREGKLGLLPQHSFTEEFKLPLSVYELTRSALPERTNKKEANEKISKILRELGMEKFANTHVGLLSGGERQKAFLSHAIAGDPDILFLDEPMNAVDEKSQNDFYEILKKLNEKGTAIFMISHDIEMIVKHAKHILCLNKRLNKSCSVSDLRNYSSTNHHKHHV